MDRPLDDVISDRQVCGIMIFSFPDLMSESLPDRQGRNNIGGRNRYQSNWPRDDSRKVGAHHRFQNLRRLTLAILLLRRRGIEFPCRFSNIVYSIGYITSSCSFLPYRLRQSIPQLPTGCDFENYDATPNMHAENADLVLFSLVVS